MIRHLIAGFLLFLFALAPNAARAAECTSDIDGMSDAELEVVLDACNAEIAAENEKLAETQREATSIEAGIAAIDYEIRLAQLEIKRRNVEIARLGDEIDLRESTIEDLEAKKDRMQSSLAELIRKSNELSSFSIVEAVLSGEQLSDFFQNVDDFEVVKVELQSQLEEVRLISQMTSEEKDALEVDQEEERLARYQREKEKAQEENYKAERQRVLDVTRDQEKSYQQVIAEKERVKNQIRNRLFRTVGGAELTFGEALQLVRQTEDRVGVNPALILAVLTQESSVDGKIGANIGKCTYNQSANNAAGTVMSNSQKPAFLAIMNELGLDPDTTPVSCPIYVDGAHGGAMGPSQFMPNTWWDPASETGYKKRVSKVLGKPNPSPFEPLDAFTGTALYLSDALALCKTGFYNTKELRQCTAAKYYSGLRNKGQRLYKHMYPLYSYGNQVALRAAKFEEDIRILDL